jgi:DNA-directed RNA polymerase subunit L
LNITIAELLRVYLNLDDKVTFAAWRRLHPTENPVVKVETSGKDVKKAVEDAVMSVVKEFEKIEKDFYKI